MSYRNVGKMMPGFIKQKYKLLLRYCDINMETEKFVGLCIVLGMALSLAISVNFGIILSFSLTKILLIWAGTFVGFLMITYIWLILKADSKGRYIENIMPDALLLMAMNIKSGMTTDKALIMSARPEFGPLEKELNHAGRQVLGGKPIKTALIDMASRVRSPLLDRTIRLIVEGIESGGELSELLEQTAEDIQSMKIVRNEVQASVMMYAIFIFFASAIGAPLLFGISTYLVTAITKQSQLYAVDNSIASSSSQQLSFQPTLGGLNVSPDTLVLFAILSITITSIFAGLIIGIIKDGQEKAGIRLIPILLAVSISIFFLVRGFVSSILAI